MSLTEPATFFFERCIQQADPSWHEILRDGLSAIEAQTPGYLSALPQSYFFPIGSQLFAAFSQPLISVSYVLIGEGPYPRIDSANGYCFMDGAVGSLWASEIGGGLSKQVNRATSLRNFMKMLLVAEQHINLRDLSAETIAEFAQKAKQHPSYFVQTMAQLQANFLHRGFLLLNASLVFRENIPPIKDAKAWLPFLNTILGALSQRQKHHQNSPLVILWGKIADRLMTLESLQDPENLFVIRAEHPYNLSFISNSEMHTLFAPLQLLQIR